MSRAIAINEAAVPRGARAIAAIRSARRVQEMSAISRQVCPDIDVDSRRLFGAKLGWDGGDLMLGAARVLRKLGRVDEVDAELQRAAATWQNLPPDHPSRGTLAIEIGFAAMADADNPTARAQSGRAHRLLRKHPTDDAARRELAALDAGLLAAGG